MEFYKAVDLKGLGGLLRISIVYKTPFTKRVIDKVRQRRPQIDIPVPKWTLPSQLSLPLAAFLLAPPRCTVE